MDSWEHTEAAHTAVDMAADIEAEADTAKPVVGARTALAADTARSGAVGSQCSAQWQSGTVRSYYRSARQDCCARRSYYKRSGWEHLFVCSARSLYKKRC